MSIPHTEMLLRMGVSVVLGAAIGYERERTGRPAGLRTHLLVSLASATVMLVSTQFVFYQHYTKEDLVTIDTSRIAAGVVTGVGFLGAGAILRTGLSIQGLTTAASLWLVAAVGLAAGGGMYPEAGVATLVTLCGLVLLRRVEGKQWRQMRRRVTILLADEHAAGETSGIGGRGEDLVARLRSEGATVSELDYDRNVKARRSRLRLDIGFRDSESLERLLADLEASPGVRRIKIERPD